MLVATELVNSVRGEFLFSENIFITEFLNSFASFDILSLIYLPGISSHFISYSTYQNRYMILAFVFLLTALSGVVVLIKTIRQMKLKLAYSEVARLHGVIVPHAVGNLFTSLQYMIAVSATETALELVQGYGTYMRNLVKLGEKGKAKLLEEVDLIHLYFGLEMARLNGGFSYDIACEKDLYQLKVPSMFIQPIVENAVKHAMAKMVDGFVQIVIVRHGSYLQVTVRDNGNSYENNLPLSGGGHGNRSIEQRMEALRLAGYREANYCYRFNLTSQNAPAGYEVVLTIPIMQ